MQRKEKFVIVILLYFLLFFPLKAEDTVFKDDSWNLINYFRIDKALKKYIQIQDEGGWPVLPADIILKKGDYSQHVLTLRQRLKITGDLSTAGNENLYLFDEEVEEAVKRFQYRHGLIIDGIAGPETLAAMNVSVAGRVKELRLNRERIFNLLIPM